MTPDQAKKRIAGIFKKFAAASKAHAQGALAGNLAAGKLYEAWVLAHVIQDLTLTEKLKVSFISTSKTLRFKSSPGPINASYPHFDVFSNGILIGKIWTDVSFQSLSSVKARNLTPATLGETHELDIVMCLPNSRPADS